MLVDCRQSYRVDKIVGYLLFRVLLIANCARALVMRALTLLAVANPVHHRLLYGWLLRGPVRARPLLERWQNIFVVPFSILLKIVTLTTCARKQEVELLGIEILDGSPLILGHEILLKHRISLRQRPKLILTAHKRYLLRWNLLKFKV